MSLIQKFDMLSDDYKNVETILCLSKGRFHEKEVAVLLDFAQITSPLPPNLDKFERQKRCDLSDIQNDSLSKIPLK